jgi:hypothetical protein
MGTRWGSMYVEHLFAHGDGHGEANGTGFGDGTSEVCEWRQYA